MKKPTLNIPPKNEKEKSSIEDDNPNLIDHLRHPLALHIRSLLNREERKSLNQIIIDDEENIIQAIQSNIKLQQLISTDINNLSEELRQALPKEVSIIELSKRTGKKLFGTEKISRIFAIAEMPKSLDIENLKNISQDFIVLDKLTITGNIGAIIRTSVALNAGAIILLDSESVDTFDRRIIRASRGLVFKVPILNLTTSEFIHYCKNNNIEMMITTPYTEMSIDEAIQSKNQFAIIFGSEKEGCSQALMDAADIKARIPIYGDVESLNVSAAASIILYLRNLRTRHYQLKKIDLSNQSES